MRGIMAEKTTEKKSTGLTRFRNRVISGILLLVPLFVTLVVLRFVFRIFAGYVHPLLKLTAKIDVPEPVVYVVALLMTVLALYLLGLLAGRMVIRRWISVTEKALERIPLVKSIYSSTRTVVDMLSPSNRQAFKSVVQIEFPREGIHMIGFVTGTVVGSDGQKWLKVLVPTVPNPTTGFLAILPPEEVIELDISVEDGLKMVLSGGILSPLHLPRRGTGAALAAERPFEEKAE